MAKEEVKNNSGIVGVVLGIIGLVSLLNSPMQSIVFGIVGLIFAKKQKKSGNNSWAKAGIILNILSIVLSLIFVIIVALYLKSNPSAISTISQAG